MCRQRVEEQLGIGSGYQTNVCYLAQSCDSISLLQTIVGLLLLYGQPDTCDGRNLEM